MKKKNINIYSEFVRSLGGWDRFNKAMMTNNINKIKESELFAFNENILDQIIKNNVESIILLFKENEIPSIEYNEINNLKDLLIKVMLNNYKEKNELFTLSENEDLDPLLEGITHINVYTKSRISVGRKLSNIHDSPVQLNDGKFKSLEGFWYWKMTGMKHPEFKNMSGFEAKKIGSKMVKENGSALPEYDEGFMNEFKESIRQKLKQHPEILNDLVRTVLPLKHYYYHQGTKNIISFNVIDKSKHQWQLDEMERIREACHKRLYENGLIENYPPALEEVKNIKDVIFKRPEKKHGI